VTKKTITLFSLLSVIAAMYILAFSLHVFGQTNTTPVTPNVEFIPQKAFIITVPPPGQEAAAPQNTNTENGGITGAIVGIIGIATGLYAKFDAGRKHEQNKERIRDTNAGVLETKIGQKDLAGYTFSIDPAKANALNGSLPSIKLETLEKGVQDFANKAAKT